MERTVRPRIGPLVRAVTALLALAVALGFTARPSHAGLGGLVKSAKDKATGQKPAAQTAQGGNVAFDETKIELTGDVLDKLLACRKPAAQTLKERKAMAERLSAIPGEINELRAKYDGAIADNENKRYEVESCRSAAFHELKNQKTQAMQQQMLANPASAEKMARMSVALNEAQIKGDTATFNRVSREIEAMYGPSHQDSLAVDKKCGAMPALHPQKVKLDALQKEYDDLLQRIREADAKALKLQADQCKMPAEQIAMAWERIQLYLERGPGRGFSNTELAALSERKDALAAAL